METSGSSLACQFENALEQEFTLIVVEPVGLGNESIRWIKVGNFLHKSAVITSIMTLCVSPLISTHISLFTTFPLGIMGISSAVLYNISWQYDPCCKYQVDYRGKEVTRIPSHDIHSPSPVVLVRRNDKYRKVLHNSLSLVVLGYMGWKLYNYFS